MLLQKLRICRFKETGVLEAKNSRTASCACPGEATHHDVQICRHMRYTNLYWQQKKSTPFTIDWWVLLGNLSSSCHIYKAVAVPSFQVARVFFAAAEALDRWKCRAFFTYDISKNVIRENEMIRKWSCSKFKPGSCSSNTTSLLVESMENMRRWT